MSAFDAGVLQALCATAGYGETTSYGDLAHGIGRGPADARKVGGALARNRVLIIVPCHRVVAADGALTGYAGGLATKRRYSTWSPRTGVSLSHACDPAPLSAKGFRYTHPVDTTATAAGASASADDTGNLAAATGGATAAGRATRHASAATGGATAAGRAAGNAAPTAIGSATACRATRHAGSATRSGGRRGGSRRRRDTG